MKISNETKVGILAIAALTLLILGFNFLKGKNLFGKSHKIYAVFPNTEALEKASPVRIRGRNVGKVYDLQFTSEYADSIIVTITLSENVKIAKNSVAVVDATLLGTPFININPADISELRKTGKPIDWMEYGDTLKAFNVPGLMQKLDDKLDPTLATVNKTLDTLKMTVSNINSIFDPATKSSIQQLIANLMVSSANLQQMLNAQTGSLAKSLNNMETFTGNLNKNNEHINKTMENIDAATAKFAALKIDETVASLNGTVNELQKLMTKANGNGTLGKLLNDPGMYNNLNSTLIKVQTLLDDLRVHPKRYTGSIIFNRKDKTGPLTSPTEIDTLKNK